MHPSPLLIGGCPRSGTTALLQVLNSNPSCFISSEENIFKQLGVLSKGLSTQERRKEVLINKGMRDLSPRESLNEKNIHSHNFSQDSLWPTLQFIYQYHHKKLHAGFPLILWGDKFPNYFKDIDAVLEVSEVKYLHITRNPLDVVNSIMRRCEMTRQGKDWWKAITEFSAMINCWAEAFRVIRENECHSNVFHLHYEELVYNFSDCSDKINDFLGVNLTYENILISTKDKHHDRKFLTRDMIGHILTHPTVKDYADTVKDMPYVSSAFVDKTNATS